MARTPHKIRSLTQLAAITERLRADAKTVVHCHGTFDPLHIGHIRHFEQARTFGDVLVVTVTPDRFVNKGPQRPVFSEQLRAEAIAALSCVDYVAVNETPMAVETIELLRPGVFVKGSEFAGAQKDRTGAISLEEEAVERVGGRTAFTYDITFSASNLINHHFQVFPQEVSEYLASFGDRYSARDIITYLEAARPLRVLVVGEAIVDEYQYCEAIGKSSKEPTLAVRQLSKERFAGGIVAVANHVANFVDDASMVALLGDSPSHEEFLQAHLPERINSTLVHRRGAPTIVKRRFVESYFFTKMLEVYEIDDEALSQHDEAAVCAALAARVPEVDVVEVVDFGHGMLTDRAIDVISREAKFLAVNVQSNAGNHGYHTLSRYPRADYISLNESELRLDARDRRGEIEEMTRAASRRLGGRIAVTRGKRGCLLYDDETGFVRVPAFAQKVVDRVGAGDAFLAITALCAAQRAPLEVLGFVGNAVGAQAVSSVGNARSIERVPLFRQIECLLK